MTAFNRWWHEHGQYLTDRTKKEIARTAWAAAIEWWSEQLNEVVKMPPKESREVKLTVDKPD